MKSKCERGVGGGKILPTKDRLRPRGEALSPVKILRLDLSEGQGEGEKGLGRPCGGAAVGPEGLPG